MIRIVENRVCHSPGKPRVSGDDPTLNLVPGYTPP